MSTAHETYLFYDLETTGLNKCFDQVVQFAAIRTDKQLRELERHEIMIRLLPDVTPAPDAIITHRIGIKQMQQGESEISAIQKIHHLLNTPGTISVGYNSLSFDDEFLRFSFYRNLLAPYTHQYANQCGRMDIYPMVTMYFLFNNDSLRWPTIENKISLKLEAINQQNNLASGQAHNAMVDVEVTLALARKLLKQKKMWNYLIKSFDKKTDLNRMTQLPFSLAAGDCQFQEGIMVSGTFGHNNAFHVPVVGLGQHLHYKNQSLWLRLDQEILGNTSLDLTSIAENTFVIRKKPAEQPILLPPSERFKSHLSKERKQITDKNRLWLQKNPDIMRAICQYHCNFKYPKVEHVDSQAILYEAGFPSPQQERLYASFHQAKAAQKSALAEKISDRHRRELAHRLVARHFPDALSQHAKADYEQYCQQIQSDKPPIDFRGEPQRNRQQALDTINELRQKTLEEEQVNLLNEFESELN